MSERCMQRFEEVPPLPALVDGAVAEHRGIVRQNLRQYPAPTPRTGRLGIAKIPSVNAGRATTPQSAHKPTAHAPHSNAPAPLLHRCEAHQSYSSSASLDFPIPGSPMMTAEVSLSALDQAASNRAAVSIRARAPRSAWRLRPQPAARGFAAVDASDFRARWYSSRVTGSGSTPVPAAARACTGDTHAMRWPGHDSRI